MEIYLCCVSVAQGTVGRCLRRECPAESLSQSDPGEPGWSRTVLADGEEERLRKE